MNKYNIKLLKFNASVLIKLTFQSQLTDFELMIAFGTLIAENMSNYLNDSA